MCWLHVVLNCQEKNKHDWYYGYGDLSLFQFFFLGFQNEERVRTVTEAAGISMSEIASCSYEARAKGVKNGMFMGSALKLCPELGNKKNQT